jgi:Tfp pilus assembly protein PilF
MLEKLCHKKWLITLVLIGITLIVYFPVKDHEFIGYDESRYITHNNRVQAGLNWDNVVWAFTTYEFANWHPLTWLSHMLDCELFGLSSSWHHVTNLVLHLANVALLFGLLESLTGKVGRSAFVAALFAIHPLNVESVAWLAERKNLLCTLFWLLALWAYFRYVRHPDWNRYSLVVTMFVLGLLSKPMVVTLPFVMLLLDYWPLGRFDLPREQPKPNQKKGRARQKSAQQVEPRPIPFWLKSMELLWEKAPLFLLVLISSAVTVKAQKFGGAINSGEALGLGTRLANGVVAYIKYLVKMCWPINLSVFYPHPEATLPFWQVCLSTLVVAAITFFVFKNSQQYRYLAVGWFWFLGTLVPVIGLVQVGKQAMADRYVYIPLMGLFILIVWGASDLAGFVRWNPSWLAWLGGLVVIALMLRTSLQLSYWHDSSTLFEHAARSTNDNYIAYDALGMVSAERGELEKAAQYFGKALEIRPTYANARKNLAGAEHNQGVALARQGKLEEAVTHYRRALKLQPENAEFHYNLGLALYSQGTTAEAMEQLSRALHYQPSHFKAQRDLGSLLAKEGRLEEAVAHYLAAIRIQADPTTYFNLGKVASHQGKSQEAIQYYAQALKLRPDYAEARRSLNSLLGNDNHQGVTATEP